MEYNYKFLNKIYYYYISYMEGHIIPTIDLTPYKQGSENTKEVALTIRQACKKVGFFYIKNHGVPSEAYNAMLASIKKFFSLSREEKRQIRMELSGKAWRGYYQIGEEYTNGILDHHECIYAGKEQGPNHPNVIKKQHLNGQNLYPRQVPEFKVALQWWLRQMDMLGKLLMQAFAESLGLKRNYFTDGLCKDHFGFMHIFHYPEVPKNDKTIQPLGEHCDYGFLTMLIGTGKGLQVKTVDNQWVDIELVPGTFVINIGDMMQKMTKGFYKSTPHRVVCSGQERYSFPYFYDPGWDEKILEIEFPIGQDEQDVIKKNKQYKRVDDVKVDCLNKTIGEYYVFKNTSSFPEIAKKISEKA